MYGCSNDPLPEGLPRFRDFDALDELVSRIVPIRGSNTLPAGRKRSRRSTVRRENREIVFSLYNEDIARVSAFSIKVRAAAQTHLAKRYLNDLFAEYVKRFYMYRGTIWVTDLLGCNFKVPKGGWMHIDPQEIANYDTDKFVSNYTITGWEKVLRFVPIKNALRHKLAQYKDFLDYVEGCLYVMGDTSPRILQESLPYPPMDRAWFKHETVPIYMGSGTHEELRRRRTIFFDAVQDPDRWYGAFVSLVCLLKGGVKNVRREFINMLRYQYPDQLLHRVEVQPCEAAVTYHYDNYVMFCGDMSLRNKLTSCQ